MTDLIAKLEKFQSAIEGSAAELCFNADESLVYIGVYAYDNDINDIEQEFEKAFGVSGGYVEVLNEDTDHYRFVLPVTWHEAKSSIL